MRCADCEHDGQCDGLPYCGGAYYRCGWERCGRCGERVWWSDAEEDDDGHPLCPRCLSDEGAASLPPMGDGAARADLVK